MHLKQNHFLKLKKPQVEEKLQITNHIPDKSLVSRISFLKLLQLSNKKSSTPIQRWAKTQRHIFQRNTDGQHAYEQILNVTDHQRRGNQDHK